MEFQENQHHLATILSSPILTATKASINQEASLLLSYPPPAYESHQINYWSILHLLITILLCLISLFVVLGNSLVVGAIWHENQLHSVTNYLIASLAVADCLVGLLVMPFSIISEIILGSWSFGATWCDLWHSFDVLASTASIMNLCAISLDRYLAITDPISYPARMTPKRVALLIVSLWTCSALISFPAIIWWHSVGQGPLAKIESPSASLHLDQLQIKTTTLTSINSYKQPGDKPVSGGGYKWEQQEQASAGNGSSAFDTYRDSEWPPDELSKAPGGFQPPDSPPAEQLYKCVFTDDTYYLLFSSFISFYGPLCVMLYAYYRIYKAAVKQMRFLKHGSKQVMLDDKMANGSHASFASGETGRNGLVLRVHRGGGGGGAGNSLNLKSVLNKQNNCVTSTVVASEQPLPVADDKQARAGQVLYYESGKLFHKLTRLKDFSTTSVDANSAASSTTAAGRALCQVAGGGELASDAAQTEPGEGLEANDFIEPGAPPADEPDNKTGCQPEGTGGGAVVAACKPTLNSKLYSNQHVIQIPSSHQSNCVAESSAAAAANAPDSTQATPARSHSTIVESSSLGTITPGNTPQHKSLQQQQQTQQQQHRKVGRKLSRLAKERKAAKTLGIVVGVFILCWLPYFVVNITVGLCGSRCISHLEIFMPIVTWLGWLNSAMNPVIYACWSREFRRAFRRVLCSWVIFFCPYGDSGQKFIKKLKLKDNSNYSSNANATSSQQEAHSFSTVTRPTTLSNSLRLNPTFIARANLADNQPGTVAASYTSSSNNNNCIVTISSPLKDDE